MEQLPEVRFTQHHRPVYELTLSLHFKKAASAVINRENSLVK